jgi:hypothetical protein
MSMHIDFASPTEPSEEDVDGITELSAEDLIAEHIRAHGPAASMAILYGRLPGS